MENANVQRLRRPLVVEDFERMNLPREFWTAKIQSVQESVRETITRYLVNIDMMVEKGAGMLLMGPVGVGKSGIASLVCKEARSRGYTAYFVGVWELREAIRARIGFDSDSSVLDRCRDVDVLVLDGLRPEDSTERLFGMRDIEELVAMRGSRKKVTIVTARMTAPDFNKSFPSFLGSVQGCLVALPVSGNDLRRTLNDELKRVVLGTE